MPVIEGELIRVFQEFEYHELEINGETLRDWITSQLLGRHPEFDEFGEERQSFGRVRISVEVMP